MPTPTELIAAAGVRGAGAAQFAALDAALRADPCAGRVALDSQEGTYGAVVREHPAEAHAAWLSMFDAMLATGSAACVPPALERVAMDLRPDTIDAPFLQLLLSHGRQEPVQQRINRELAGTIDLHYEEVARGRTDPWGNPQPPEVHAAYVGRILAQLPAPLQASARSAVRARSVEIADLIERKG